MSRKIKIYYTQWDSEANLRVYFVDKAHKADIVLCEGCHTKNGIQIVKYKMNADIILKKSKRIGFNTIPVYVTNLSNTKETAEQRKNFSKYFNKYLVR